MPISVAAALRLVSEYHTATHQLFNFKWAPGPHLFIKFTQFSAGALMRSTGATQWLDKGHQSKQSVTFAGTSTHQYVTNMNETLTMLAVVIKFYTSTNVNTHGYTHGPFMPPRKIRLASYTREIPALHIRLEVITVHGTQLHAT